ncbi:MAG TPA: FAD/NAD(P)-binding protein [Phycisphaerae bacterium]|nr:FAD/NAD(P)-binding protein [Phycisphaerae bacterium]
MADTVEEQTLASPYLPKAARIARKENFTKHECFYELVLPDGEQIEYQCGQFMQVSVLGVGEAPISISSAPGRTDRVEMCIRAVGDVTNALHALSEGDEVGLRGPFGNGFDMGQLSGQHCLFVAGGLGLAPCRSFILQSLRQREQFGDVTIFYGTRTPQDLLFQRDLEAWQKRLDCELMVTVDRGNETWTGRTGLITRLFREVTIDPARTAVFIIGPPVMFKFAVLEVLAMGVPESKIYCSLERRMKCGLGKCGHCQIRHVYVCQDGPIFSYQQVKKLREGI